MALSIQEIEQIRGMFNLNIEQIKENSVLRRRINYVTQLDLDEGTTYIATIQQRLREITQLSQDRDDLINTATNVKREKLDGEFEVEYYKNNESGIYSSYNYKIAIAMAEIATILQIKRRVRT